MARSLHSKEGVLMYVAQPSFDTPVTPTTGISMAEFNVTDDGDFRQVMTLGKETLHKNKGGIARTTFSVNISNVASKAILERAERTSGEVPYTTFAFGSSVGGTNEAWQVSDCKVDQLEVSLDGGGFLSASLQGIGREITVVTTLSATHDANDPFLSYEAVSTLGGNSFEVKGFRFSVNNNLNVEAVIKGAARTSGEKRYWDYLTEGFLTVSGSVTLARKHDGTGPTASAFGADCPVDGQNLVISLTDVCDGAHTIVFTITQAEFLSQTRNVPLDGYMAFELPFTGYGFTIV
jgi:hypothetical protein